MVPQLRLTHDTTTLIPLWCLLIATVVTAVLAAKIIRAGRRIYFASGEVRDEHDNLVASAEAVYAYVDRDAQRRPTDKPGS